METSLDTADRELKTFQWEKQQRLNELYVVVPLKLHQVTQDDSAGAEWPMYI